MLRGGAAPVGVEVPLDRRCSQPVGATLPQPHAAFAGVRGSCVPAGVRLTCVRRPPPPALQARQRLARGVLVGLHHLARSGGLRGGIVETVCLFVREALPGGAEAGTRSDEEEGEGADASRRLGRLGQLPLLRLLQLHAFLAVRLRRMLEHPGHVDRQLQVIAQSSLVSAWLALGGGAPALWPPGQGRLAAGHALHGAPWPPRHHRLFCLLALHTCLLQEQAVVSCQPAERTQQGAIRLSGAGLESVSRSLGVLEVRAAPAAACLALPPVKLACPRLACAAHRTLSLLRARCTGRSNPTPAGWAALAAGRASRHAGGSGNACAARHECGRPACKLRLRAVTGRG